MKNILLIIALFAFLNSYATDPLSWGKKGGSGGVTQSQLDAKVDTSLIKTGQEALDSLSVNISRTVYGELSDFKAINNTLNTKLIGATLFEQLGGSSITLSSGTALIVPVNIYETDTLDYVRFSQNTTGNFTGTGNNRITAWTYDSGNLVMIDSTANDETIWKYSISDNVSVSFLANAIVEAGTVVFFILEYNSSSQTTAPSIYGSVINRWSAYYWNSEKLFSTTSSPVVSPYDLSSGSSLQYTPSLFIFGN